MELVNYKIKEIISVPDVPLILPPNGIVKASIYASKPTAQLTYDLPFRYNDFKLLCLITIFKHEGVSFNRMFWQSSTHEYYEYFKGFLIDHTIDKINNDLFCTIEMTIQITETIGSSVPKRVVW